jgi:hypothetical protein
MIPITLALIFLCINTSVSEAFVGHHPRQQHFALPSSSKLQPYTKQNPLNTFHKLSKTTTDIVKSIRGGDTSDSEEGASTTKNNNVVNTLSGRELLAELIGTFLIVQIGTASVMSAIFTDSLVRKKKKYFTPSSNISYSLSNHFILFIVVLFVLLLIV